MSSLLIHTAKLSVLCLLFIYPLLSSVLFTAIHERLHPSVNHTTFHGWNITTSSTLSLYEGDLTRLLFLLPSLVTIVLYLPFNDGVGQKITYRLPVLGLFLSSLCCLLSSVRSFHSKALLYAALVIYSLCGGTAFILIGCLWCINNSTENGSLSEAYGFMMTAMYFGYAVSSGVKSFVEVDGQSAAITCTVSSIVMLVLSLLWTVEAKRSNKPEKMDKTPEKLCDLYRFAPTALVPFRRESGYIIMSLICLAVYRGCEASESTAINIFTSDPKGLNWTKQEFDVYEMAVFLCQGVGTALLPRLLIHYAHATEITVVMVALGFKVLSLGFTSFAVEPWMMYLNLPIELLAPLLIPCLLSLIHKLCGPGDYAQIYHVLTASWLIAESLTPLITICIGLSVYKLFTGAVFLIVAALMVLLFCGALWLSVDLQTHNHRSLLESFRPDSEAAETSIQQVTEQWLLEAYEQEVKDSEGEGQVLEVASTNNTSDGQTSRSTRQSV